MMTYCLATLFLFLNLSFGAVSYRSGNVDYISDSNDTGEITVALKPDTTTPAYRSKTFITQNSVTSITPTEPAGSAQDDILFMFVVISSSATAFNGPTGWTLLHTSAGTPTTGGDARLYWIRRGASAPSYGISWTGSAYVEVSVTAWSGAPGATAPAGYTLHESGGLWIDLAVASKAVAVAGIENPGRFTGQGRTSVDIQEPVGAALNDVFFLMVVSESTMTNVTPPLGWNLLYTITNTLSETRLYWIRRGSSAPDLTLSWDYPTGYHYIEYSVTAWSGAWTTGNPIDVMNANAATIRATPDCPAVTTTVANTLVIAFGMDWDGWSPGGATAPTGYTRHIGDSIWLDIGISSKTVATPSTEDPSAYGNGGGSNEVAEITVALKEQPGRVRHRVIQD